MMPSLTLILTCQLVWEAAVTLFGLPVPGPVVGMLVLLALLFVRGSVPQALERTTSGLLGAMSMLFVPAGTGVILHFQLLGEALIPLGLAVLVSTALTILVTALLMRWLAREQIDG